MEAEAKTFEEEKKNNPEEADDHDTRKLPKPERMRLVTKNKEVRALSYIQWCIIQVNRESIAFNALCMLWLALLALRRREGDSTRSYGIPAFHEMLLRYVGMFVLLRLKLF